MFACSLRAPKMGNPSADPAPWAIEAKEYLRKLVIGKDVAVQMEYTRKITPTPGTEDFSIWMLRELSFDLGLVLFYCL